ncbi:unnamed protein product [Rotaria sordida]|uniref:Uncharacterized protein n=1 Tax=Rotaria sordida TaxID=392033 RepID=A0A815TI43_9BILA|nr:unnamed protein product [Rotaria sordida]CAF1508863.1 unnamed protein product [Rotaria sordida]
MGCGPSAATQITNSTTSQIKTNSQSKEILSSLSQKDVIQRRTSATSQTNKQTRTPSSTSQNSEAKRITSQTGRQTRTPSATSQNGPAKRTTSASSKASSTILKLSTGGKKSANPSIHSQYDINQNLVIIWVDPHIDDLGKLYQDSITKLNRITNLIYTFTNSDQCTDCIDTINEKTVVLIVSDLVGEQLVLIIFGKPQLEYIYIFNPQKQLRANWANKWAQKVKGIFHDMEQIFQAIKADSGQIGSVPPISILPKNEIEIQDSEPNELDKSFMYTQLLKEILFDMKYDY